MLIGPRAACILGGESGNGYVRAGPEGGTVPQPDTRVRVMVVDDYAVVRQCLPLFLDTLVDDITVVGVAGSGAEALDALPDLRPDIVLLGLTLPDLSGSEVARRMHETQPEAKVVVFTGHDDEATLQRLPRMDVCGCLTKQQPMEQVVAAIRAVAAGQTVWPLGTPPPRARDGITLTGREKEVLHQLGTGQHNAEIAATLRIAPTTVEFHVHNLFCKLGVYSRTEVVLKAQERGLL